MLKKIKNYLKQVSFSVPKSHSFVKKPLKSDKGFFTLILGIISITIPSSYLSIIKNFGFGILLGFPTAFTLGNIVYTMTSDITLVDLHNQTQEIFTEMDRLFSQLNGFISQFHNFINQNSINVITDAHGELSIDVIGNLDDSTIQQYVNRINIFDRLIRSHIESLENLLERLSNIETQIHELDDSYTSRLSYYRNTLRQINHSYGH